MKINLVPTCIYGNIQYTDSINRITASSIAGKWYPTINTELFDAGFTNIASMTNFLSKLDEYEETLSMFGFCRDGNTFINDLDPTFKCEISIKDDGLIEVDSFVNPIGSIARKYHYQSDDFDKVTEYVIELIDGFHINIFESVMLVSSEDAKYVVEAKMTTRDLAKDLVRVKSSNLWSYGINIKNRKDKKGDVLVQFKNPEGGPGDIYQYLEVPVMVWRKWLAATSKGHFLWQYIRNNYRYRKLTGDKRGKLPNAIN